MANAPTANAPMATAPTAPAENLNLFLCDIDHSLEEKFQAYGNDSHSRVRMKN
jgi:hypothetical protein